MFSAGTSFVVDQEPCSWVCTKGLPQKLGVGVGALDSSPILQDACTHSFELVWNRLARDGVNGSQIPG
jgi:hypothetical protein